MYRDHELVVSIRRTWHPDGAWRWECPSGWCRTPEGRAATHSAAIQAACEHLAYAFDRHHQVEDAHEGGDGIDGRATCRCGAERTGRADTNGAETYLEFHIELAAESIPTAYRKPQS